MARLFRIGFAPGEEISARLEAMDRGPRKIDIVINSRLHFDHVRGNALIPNATMLVQRREWDARMDPDLAHQHGFNPRDFDRPQQTVFSTVNTMCSATARSSACRHTAIRRATSRCVCDSMAGTS